ncbi:MAG: leucine dehydrogenase [Candidatus Scalindua rubra]|uniref:Leucine dehydrogenase n=1 Tax=Candidatus Scalindua rubra TaxID=1872076 RepID=A0A1E3XGL3_9BACT|nr:MAG: leucine dehydrogenase [Candidatus Scalindua rubra]
MDIFREMQNGDHEKLVFCNDNTSGLRAIIDIHSTKLGPAIGGCRFLEYHSEDEAIKDVLRLSKAMTYKSAVSELAYGGGKAVIIKSNSCEDRDGILRAFGRFVESVNGRYITTVDSGTSMADMISIRSETRHVTGVPVEMGGLGDPSPITALGVVWGMKACLIELYGNNSLKNKTVAIQGVGNVGYHLALLLHKEDAKLIASDVDAEKTRRLGSEIDVKIISPEQICYQEVDILSPCALANTVNEDIIPHFKCNIIAGGANNQLSKEEDADLLHQRGILYAPDYVINAGGLIHVVAEYEGMKMENVYENISKIYQRIRKIISVSREKDISTNRVTNSMVQEKMNKLRE